MNATVMLHALHDPPKGAKTMGVERNDNAIRTCASCTKNWVTHANDNCLELSNNAANCKSGWKSYFM